jgi:hypothetical protein
VDEYEQSSGRWMLLQMASCGPASDENALYANLLFIHFLLEVSASVRSGVAFDVSTKFILSAVETKISNSNASKSSVPSPYSTVKKC